MEAKAAQAGGPRLLQCLQVLPVSNRLSLCKPVTYITVDAADCVPLLHRRTAPQQRSRTSCRRSHMPPRLASWRAGSGAVSVSHMLWCRCCTFDWCVRMATTSTSTLAEHTCLTMQLIMRRI